MPKKEIQIQPPRKKASLWERLFGAPAPPADPSDPYGYRGYHEQLLEIARRLDDEGFPDAGRAAREAAEFMGGGSPTEWLGETVLRLKPVLAEYGAGLSPALRSLIDKMVTESERALR